MLVFVGAIFGGYVFGSPCQNFSDLYKCVLILIAIIFVGIIGSEFFSLSPDDVARCVAVLCNWSLPR